MARIPDLKSYSVNQLEKLIDQAKKEKDRLEKGVEELIGKVDALLKEHGVDFEELAARFRQATGTSPARKKRGRKATAKKAAAKKAVAKKATTRKKAAKKTAARKKTARKAVAKKAVAKKATSKKTAAKKKTGGKVPPKYRNPENPDDTWTGRGRKPKWVEAALASGKSLDDIKI